MRAIKKCSIFLPLLMIQTWILLFWKGFSETVYGFPRFIFGIKQEINVLDVLLWCIFILYAILSIIAFVESMIPLDSDQYLIRFRTERRYRIWVASKVILYSLVSTIGYFVYLYLMTGNPQFLGLVSIRIGSTFVAIVALYILLRKKIVPIQSMFLCLVYTFVSIFIPAKMILSNWLIGILFFPKLLLGIERGANVSGVEFRILIIAFLLIIIIYTIDTNKIRRKK